MTEIRMAEWRDAFAREFRAEIAAYQASLPEAKLTLKMCTGIAETALRNSDAPDPANDAVWREIIQHLLSPEEWSLWRARLDERHCYADALRPQMALAEFDALLFLASSQLEKLRPLTEKFVAEYGLDLAAQFPGTAAFGWNIRSPSVFLPFMSAESDVKAILTPVQWEYWTRDERHARAVEIWNQTSRLHEQRLHPAGK